MGVLNVAGEDAASALLGMQKGSEPPSTSLNILGVGCAPGSGSTSHKLELRDTLEISRILQNHCLPREKTHSGACNTTDSRNERTVKT